MPLVSSRNAIAIEFSHNYLWLATNQAILRMPYNSGKADKASWESWNIGLEIVDIKNMNDTIYIFTNSIVLKCYENAFHEGALETVEEIPRFPPDIGITALEEQSFYLPYGLIWLQEGKIIDLKNNIFEIIDSERDFDGNLYFATNGIGIYRIESSSYYAEEFVFGPCCDFNSIVKKHKDNIYFASCIGISKCIITKLENNTYKYINYEDYNEQYNSNIINDYIFINNKILFATPTGLELYDTEHSSWIRAIGMNSIPISSANGLEIFEGNIYIASDEGIYYADTNSRLFTHMTSIPKYCFKKIKKISGKLYTYCEQGVWIIDKNDSKKYDTPDGMITNSVLCLSEGVGGEAIFGSRYGIIIISPDGSREIYQRSTYISGAFPNDIAASRSHIWVATDKGLQVIDRKYKTVKILGETNYLPEIPISSLLLDGDWLWLSTSKGVFKFFWNEPDRIY